MSLRLSETDGKRLLAGKPVAWKKQRRAQPWDESKIRLLCRANGIPAPVREYRFAEASHGRAWRFDLAWPDPSMMIAIEIEGVVFPKRGEGGHLKGRHVSATGFKEDIVKYTAAFRLGWSVLRCLPAELQSGTAIAAVAARRKVVGTGKQGL